MVPKPGYATSEFWLTLVTALFGLALTFDWIGPDFPQEQIVGILAMVVPVAIYAISRAVAKWGAYRDKPPTTP